MVVEFAVTAGPHAGRSFRFDQHATFIVGRSTQAHFSLPDKDPHVSRLHLLVEVNPPLCRLRNMSAVNGTVVNGSKVQEADLKDGDRVTIGVTELVVRLHATANDERPTVDLQTPSPFGSDPVPLLTPPGAQVGTLPAPAGPPDITQVRPEQESAGVLDIPGYRLVRVLGRGGMGVVYEAVHAATGDVVAVKTILPKAQLGAAAVAKFVREADIVRRLDHPGIVQFRDSGTAGGMVWFAMEFVAGPDAQAVAERDRPLATGRAVGWVIQALDALAHAHDRGFVHRDVKPSNLLVSGEVGREVVKVADFGLARAYEASPLSGLTLTGSAGGTPPFMPPEQVLDMRSVKPAADQYSAAATLYRLLAGYHVFPLSGSVEELFGRILQTDPVPLSHHRPDLPAGLVAATHQALARDTAARFPTCRVFAKALRPFAD